MTILIASIAGTVIFGVITLILLIALISGGKD